MKTTKKFTPIIIGMLAMLLLSAPISDSFAKGSLDGTRHNTKLTKTKKTVNPCGVGAGDVAIYLVNCSHHHTVYSVSQISGTCNFSAGIENCGVATVYVSNGEIISHTDASGICSLVNRKH